MPCVGDEGVVLDGSEYLLGDDVTSVTEEQTGILVQCDDLSSATKHNAIYISGRNRGSNYFSHFKNYVEAANLPKH